MNKIIDWSANHPAWIMLITFSMVVIWFFTNEHYIKLADRGRKNLTNRASTRIWQILSWISLVCLLSSFTLLIKALLPVLKANA